MERGFDDDDNDTVYITLEKKGIMTLGIWKNLILFVVTLQVSILL